MDTVCGEQPRPPSLFRLFTKESLTKIEKHINEKKAAKLLAKEKRKEEGDKEHVQEEKPRPDETLEAGKSLSSRLGGEFPKELYGKPIEDLDEYYNTHYTFSVVARDKNIYRFSATNSLFVLTPFNPVRRAAIYILTHPLFSLCVMLVIMVNCVLMAANNDNKDLELAFTIIYSCEGITKIIARGFVLTEFSYLRDVWNWLDFAVVTLAYITMLGAAANLAALRTFRVLRALKTVAVVPGLKTIVGALMEAVRRLRDVMILTVFILSIFALIGLQIYSGSLTKKCVKIPPPEFENYTDGQLMEAWYKFEENWAGENVTDWKLCGVGLCDENYTCISVGRNPNYGYTSFDNFGYAMLSAFRLMTQDFWENLYQMIIRANGPWHMVFFVIVILLGSFYLVNLILAIVAMSYDEQQKQDQEAEELEEEEALEEEARRLALEIQEMKKSPSEFSCDSSEVYIAQKPITPDDKERISIKSECGMDTRRRLSIVNSKGNKASLSLPGSPFPPRRGSRGSQFGWRKRGPSPRAGDKQPLVLPYLDNLNLPYADDSNAVTPTSEDLCNSQNTHAILAQRRRLSSASHNSRIGLSHLDGTRFIPGSRRSSYASYYSRHSYTSHGGDYSFKMRDANREPTHFHWTPSVKHRGKHALVPEVIVDKTKSDDNESSSSGSECDTAKGKLFPDNPFICRTPSATMVDMKDVIVLKDLISRASGKRKSFMSDTGMTRKEWIKEKCFNLLFGWECHPNWYKFAHIVELFIMDAFVDLFITLCIVVNTLFMALDHHGMDKGLEVVLSNGNYVFTTIFTAEAALKIIALSPVNYLKDKWNCFDIVIVVLSLMEVGLSEVQGLSILRSFRLLRVFKLAKSWPTLNLLIGIIGRTLGALGNLCFVLAIIIFIFAVMGMQLFGSNYNDEKWPAGIPRWNFTDFLHSFMIVFRVLCGEWIESMWDCMHCCNFVCVPFFLLTMVIGNLVVLNLFLALLLSSFGAETLQQSQAADTEPNKLQEAVDRINRLVLFIKSHIMYCIKVKSKRKGMVDDFDPSLTRTELGSKDLVLDGEVQMRNGRICEHERKDDDSPGEEKDFRTLNLRLVKGTSKSHVGYSPVSPYEPSEDTDGHKSGDMPTRPTSVVSSSTTRLSKSSSKDSNISASQSHDSKVSQTPSEEGGSVISVSNFSYSRDDTVSIEKPIDTTEGPEINEVNVVFVRYPDECCPKCCTKNNPCCISFNKSLVGQRWWTFRCYMFRLVEHKYFETFIIFMIVASSLALAIEDVYLPTRKVLELCLQYGDKVFTVIFVFEMLIKWAAYGFKKYFTDAWCWLDFIIVTISLISLFAVWAGMQNIGAFRALRTLRALRPLRAVSRWEGMKVVVNALIQAIPSILNVLVVCMVFWLIFSIMGVQLFAGRFFKCIDINTKEKINATIVPNRNTCLTMQKEGYNYSWENAQVNFDNALSGYLCLFQVATFKGWIQVIEDSVDSKEATFKGWIDIMNDAIDSKAKNEQPEREKRVAMYLYFVLFIVFGSFFTLNLFIGVIIDNFNMQKKKAGGSLELFMTEDQKKYYNAMKKLGSKQPQKPIPKPRFKCQYYFFQLTTNQKFDIGIMSIILLNMFTMALEHYDMNEDFKSVLGYINQVFIAIFTLECVMKLIGLRWYYFKQPWNIFDFVVVVLSILGIAMADVFKKMLVSPTLLRVVRVFRVGRVLRLVKSAKGIRTLLFSLAVSLPALFNIGLLLFLVMFIYSIFGMSFFMHVKHTAGIDDMFNFETFGNSMILLFQISTSAGWDSVLAGLMNDKDCNPNATDNKVSGDCGNSMIGVFFIVTYLVISFLVVINMYIAVILENFSQATEDVQQGLTQDDFDMYYEVWEKFDEKATQYIPLSRLWEFVDTLEEPLRIPEPNYFKMVSMDINICEEDLVHCVDILDALTKNFLGTGGDTAGELGDIRKGPERANYCPISSLLKRQREILSAKIVQRTWRKYVENRRGKHGDSEKKKFEQTIIQIDEENEEEAEEEAGRTEEKNVSEKDLKMDVIDALDEDGNDPSLLNDTRTVELYPESNAVA